MTVLPREVWDEEGRVEDKAYSIIKPLVVAEGMVATLVGYDPHTSEDTTLDEIVNRPCQVGEGLGEEVYVSSGNIIKDGGYGEIIYNIGKRTGNRSFEAVGRNGLFDLAKGEQGFGERDSSEGITV